MTSTQRAKELRKLGKDQLALMHHNAGGQMGLKVYLQWRKDELVNAVLQDEGFDPWSA